VPQRVDEYFVRVLHSLTQAFGILAPCAPLEWRTDFDYQPMCPRFCAELKFDYGNLRTRRTQDENVIVSWTEIEASVRYDPRNQGGNKGGVREVYDHVYIYPRDVRYRHVRRPV
jgi:hypothetical protein